MHGRMAVPLVLFLSACAQAPISTNSTIALNRAARDQAVITDLSAARASDDTNAAQPASNLSFQIATPPERPAIRATTTRQSRRTSQAQQAATTQATQSAADQSVTIAAPEAPPKSVWDRIARRYAFPPMDNDLVREWENWYASRPDYVARMIDRSSHFLYHVVEEVEKRNMPAEIALLPMTESAYNPVAYSRSHASGMWQFISSTGKDYGLRQNWWYDGRRDVIAATDAALDYLEKLHGMFDDWNLALAAYNWGEGAVSRAIERNRARGLPTDYESLTLPPETRAYVPKLIAVKNIVTNPARYGLQIVDVPNEPYFATLPLKRHVDVKLAARFAEMPLDEFKFLNPGHNKPVIKAGQGQRIILPKDRVAIFAANFDRYDKPLVSWEAITLRRGERPDKLAAQHGMTLAELKQINGLTHQRRLAIGQPLLVPLKGAVEEPNLPDLPANPVPVALPKAIQAAKVAAHTKQAQARGGRFVKVAQTHKGRKGPPKTPRVESGKRIKVTLKAAKKTSPPAAQRQKIASR